MPPAAGRSGATATAMRPGPRDRRARPARRADRRRTVSRIPASASRSATVAATARAISVPWAIGSRRASASSARRDSIASTLKGFAARTWSTRRHAVRVAEPKPDLVHTGRARLREVDGCRERGAVTDHRLTVDAGESPDGPDDAHRDALAPDLEREQAARIRRRRKPRCHEHRNRPVVVRLARTDPRHDRVRERVRDLLPSIRAPPTPIQPSSAPGTSGTAISTDPFRALPASAPRSTSRVFGSIAIPASRPPRASGGMRPVRLDADEAPVRCLDLGDKTNLVARRAETEPLQLGRQPRPVQRPSRARSVARALPGCGRVGITPAVQLGQRRTAAALAA